MATERPRIAVIPPLALLVAAVAAVALDRLVPLGLVPSFPWGPGLVIGVPLLAASAALNTAGARAFLAAGTPINPYRPAKRLVRGGAFRITRNPMYLGMVGALLSLAPVFSVDWALVAAPLLWAAFHWGVVLPEEAYMAAKFGADYESYLATTRRWL